MSTRSVIISKMDEGYAGIYCHFDGYVEGVGKTLLQHYQDPGKVKKLIELGYISSLGERVEPIGDHSLANLEKGTTVAYSRDGGERYDSVSPVVGETFEVVADEIVNFATEYIYFFNGEKWFVDGKELAAAVEDAEKENNK